MHETLDPIDLDLSVAEHPHLGIRRDSVYLAAAGALTLVALALRLFRLNHEPLWLDEGYTLLFSQLPLDRLIPVGGAHEHPPLYYLIVHVLLGIHNSYLVPRLVSAAAGALSVFVIYRLGVKLSGQIAGFTAAILLAVSPFHIWFSQDARAYELAGLWVLLSYLALINALHRPRAVAWAVYVACTALALYTEYTTALALAPQALFLLEARRRQHIAPLLRSWGAVILVFVPWLLVLGPDAAGVTDSYWIPPPTFSEIVNTVLEFLGFRVPCPLWPCQGTQAPFPLLAGHEADLSIGVIVLVLVSVAYGLWRRNLPGVAVSLWLVFPFVFILAVSIRRPLYLDRVFLVASFPLYLVLGWMVAQIRRARLAVVASVVAAVLVWASIGSLRPLYAQITNPDWISAARDLQAAYRPGQAVVYNPGVLRSLVQSYFPAGWHPTHEAPLWFHSYLDVPGWQQRYAALGARVLHDPRIAPGLRNAHLDEILRDDQLKAVARGTRQVWLVAQDYSGLAETRHWFLMHGYHLLISQIYAGDTRIELWDRKGPASFGRAVLADDGFLNWARTGRVAVRPGTARENGGATMTRSFPITAGVAYVANIDYRGLPPASPLVQIQTYDRSGRVVGVIKNGYGWTLDSFPRTQWYGMPANGVWLSEPFGFVAPPGAVRAVMTLESKRGSTDWRHIAVYRER